MASILRHPVQQISIEIEKMVSQKQKTSSKQYSTETITDRNQADDLVFLARDKLSAEEELWDIFILVSYFTICFILI